MLGPQLDEGALLGGLYYWKSGLIEHTYTCVVGWGKGSQSPLPSSHLPGEAAQEDGVAVGRGGGLVAQHLLHLKLPQVPQVGGAPSTTTTTTTTVLAAPASVAACEEAAAGAGCASSMPARGSEDKRS